MPVFDKDAKAAIELFVGRAAQLAMLACEREVMVLDAADVPMNGSELRTVAWRMIVGTILSLLGAADKVPLGILA